MLLYTILLRSEQFLAVGATQMIPEQKTVHSKTGKQENIAIKKCKCKEDEVDRHKNEDTE